MDKHARPRDVPPRTFADGVGGGQGRTADDVARDGDALAPVLLILLLVALVVLFVGIGGWL
jgi:hypothetical protein